MLLAKSSESHIINCLNYSREKLQQIQSQAFFCLSCKEKLKLKIGKVRMPHFAHLPDSVCQAFSEAESPEHLALKKVIHQWENSAQLEVYLPLLAQRPDCLIGEKLCLEIQCSALSLEKLVERTNNYQQKGYQVLWILGRKFALENRLSSLQRGFMNYSKNCGYHLWSLDLQTKQLILYYHILEDYCGNIYYQHRKYPFFQGKLTEILALAQQGDFTSHQIRDSSPVLKKYHQENCHALQKREKSIMNLQEKLYRKQLHLLKLPKYYYFPALKPIFAQKDFFLWKQAVFEFLEEGASIKETLFHLSKLNYPAHELPNMLKSVYLVDFLLEEINGLKRLNCLLEQNGKYYLKKCQTRHVIPYDYNWKKIPKIISCLPRKL